MSVDLKLSANIKLGSKTIPLTSPPVNEIIGEVKGKAKDVKEAFSKGISFGLPPGTELDVQLKDIVDFIKKGAGKTGDILGLNIVDKIFGEESPGTESTEFSKTLQESHINVSAFHVNTKGAFSIAVKFVFGEGGLVKLIGEAGDDDDFLKEVTTLMENKLNIKSLGFAFDWENKDRDASVGKKETVAIKKGVLFELPPTPGENSKDVVEGESKSVIDLALKKTKPANKTKKVTTSKSVEKKKPRVSKSATSKSKTSTAYDKKKTAEAKTGNKKSITTKKRKPAKPKSTKETSIKRDIPKDAPDIFG